MQTQNGDDVDGDFRHCEVDVGEVVLHVVEAGERGAGPLVVLLHGFPEFWWSWRHQIRALAAAGCHVVAPDMRGFHLSDKPRAVQDYRLERLETDVVGLIRACGASRAVVVGHDWGAAVAWSLAQHHPDMVERLGVLNVPHPEWWLVGLRKAEQLRKSWYMLFFQLPALPEWWLSRNDFANLRRFFFAGDGMPAADVQRYVDAAAKAERLRGGVNYYRAWVRRALTGRVAPLRRIDTPTLVIWGEQDRFIGKEMATPPTRWVPNARVELIPEASHWVQHDAPERVNELLLDFLADLPRAPRRADASAS